MKSTGREFKCIGLSESKMHKWSQYFTKGETYIQVYDFFGPDETTLLLVSDFGVHFWVDASQFELVKKSAYQELLSVINYN